MNKSVNSIFDDYRNGKKKEIKKLYARYKHILNAYIRQKKINEQYINEVENYFEKCVRDFADYDTGYDILPYLYNKLENFKIGNSDNPIIDNKVSTKYKDRQNKISLLIEENYNKYYYIINDFIKDYDYSKRQDVTLYAQNLLKHSVEELIELNKSINEKNIKKYFENFNLSFIRDTESAENILKKIYNGKDEYINIFIDKYVPYIENIINTINGNEYSRQLFINYLYRIIEDYNKSNIKTNYSINTYILKDFKQMEEKILQNRKDFIYALNMIKNGKREYIYSIYDIFSNKIKNVVENSRFNNELIEKYIEKSILNIVYNNLESNPSSIKNEIYKKLNSIDRDYFLYINNSPYIKINTYISKIKKGDYKCLDDLVDYYKFRAMQFIRYSEVKKNVVDDILTKLVTFDVQNYIFSKYYYSYSLSYFIEYRTRLYKKILDKYLKDLENINVDLEELFRLSKTDSKYLYLIYKKYESKVSDICRRSANVKIESIKYRRIMKIMLYNSIKNYVKVSNNPNPKDFKKYVDNDFEWLSEINKTKTK